MYLGSYLGGMIHPTLRRGSYCLLFFRNSRREFLVVLPRQRD